MISKESTVLDKIKKRMFTLGNKRLSNNLSILQSLRENDLDALVQVKIPATKKIQSESEKIDNDIVATLSLYCPEAGDLRLLVAFLKITTELVRIHTNTNSFVKEFSLIPYQEMQLEQIIPYLVSMYENTCAALDNAFKIMNLHKKEDVQDLFKQVYAAEAQTDQFYRLIESDVLSLTHQYPEQAIAYLDLLKAVRRLEKIADRALNIASLLHFAQLGGPLSKHIKPE